MKKSALVIAGLLLIGVFTFLLWPLKSKKFAITFDEKLLASKRDFLIRKPPEHSDGKKPNVILILADDLGLYDISLTGSPLINTPNIDQLATEGVVCTQAYVTAPVCAPSRAGLITGRYQHRFGFENQILERYPSNRLQSFWAHHLLKSYPWRINKMKAVPRKKDRKRQGIPPSEITLAELFKKHCYSTAIIGKWHLGSSDFSLPLNLGFDYHYGFYNSHSLYTPEGTNGIIDMHNPDDWTDQHIWASQRKGTSAMYRNGKKIEEDKYLTHRFAEEATQFIEKNQHRPFFLYVPFSAPHTPLQVPKSYYDQFSDIKDPVKRIYNAMIKVLDEAVGQINDKIKELALEENTLIFFLSDNGGAAYTLTTDNYPLNGGKITGFEGGLRVPFFIKWKGQIEKKSVFNHPISSMDVFTTACHAARIELPQDRTIDGINLLPFLNSDKKGERPHQALFWKAGSVGIILKEDWKLIFDEQRNQSRLYHLEKDPYEKINLANDFPKKLSELKKEFQNWSKTLPVPAWPSVGTFSHEDENGVFLFDI